MRLLKLNKGKYILCLVNSIYTKQIHKTPQEIQKLLINLVRLDYIMHVSN